MSARLDDFRYQRDGITVPAIWVAVALSLLIHAALLWGWMPKMRLPLFEDPERSEAHGPLVVQLAPLPSLPPALPPSLTRQARPPKAVAHPRAPSTFTVPNRTASTRAAPAPGTPSIAAAAPERRSTGDDLTSYIEARRRARAESQLDAPPGGMPSAPPVEDDNSRSNRIAAANLGAQRRLTFGYDPTRGGGVFEIQRVGFDDAEFLFYGWNKDIRRTTKQLIEVRKGNNSDIRIAVVRKMIAIIREYEQDDFLWESQRLGRHLMLSARARDNAGLEDFLMREFFGDPGRPQ